MKGKSKELTQTLRRIKYSSSNLPKKFKITKKNTTDFLKLNKTLKSKRVNVMRKVHSRQKITLKRKNKARPKQRKPERKRLNESSTFINPEEISEFTTDERRDGI